MANNTAVTVVELHQGEISEEFSRNEQHMGAGYSIHSDGRLVSFKDGVFRPFYFRPPSGGKLVIKAMKLD